MPGRRLMARFAVRRLIAMIVVMFSISVLTFLLFEAIPERRSGAAAGGPAGDADEIHQIDDKYGFNKPIYVQYAQDDEEHLHRPGVLLHAGLQRARRDQGRACRRRCRWRSERASSGCWRRSSVGTLAAVRAGKYTDRVLTVLSMFGVSFPPFFLGAVLIYFLGYKAGIFPLGGYVKFTDDPWQWFVHLMLPWFTLSVLFVGFYSRVLRSTILDTINEDYVRTAHAKGLSERQVLIAPHAAQQPDPDHLAVGT